MADDGDEIGDLHLGTVVVNVQDMKRAVTFWTAALGYQQREQAWDPEFMMLVDPAGRQLPVSLQLTGSPSSELVRVHLDLYTSEQEPQVERLTRLGRRAPATGPIQGKWTSSSCAPQTATRSA